MRQFQTAALILSAAALAAASDVHDLKADTFKDFVSSHDLVLAEFFAPWCGHCKSLAPEYEEAATTLKEKNIQLVKVDCTEEADLCKGYGVDGYPTVKVFRGPDNVKPYSGARKAPAIISYMTKQALPAVSVLSGETIEEFKTADKVVMIAYIGADDKTANTTFAEVANALRDDYLFGATSDAALIEAAGVKAPAIVLYKTFDDRINKFEEKFDQAAITKFAKTSSTPLVGEVSPETYQSYMDAGIPLTYIFAETAEERAALAETLKPVASKHKGVVNFALIDAKAYGAHAVNLNLAADKWPALAIQDIGKNQKFPFDQSKTLTADAVAAFLDDFVAGKVEPSIKSEPIPESQDGPVVVIVAKNYQEVIMDDEKDVLVEFYAPWCGHCKALAPKYEEFAALYASNPESAKRVTIAKVDATANDVPDEIQGFPTIKLFAAGKKATPVEYSGDRSIADLVEFVKDHGTHAIDAYAGTANDADTDPDADAAASAEGDDEVVRAAAAATEKAAEGASSAESGAASVASGVKEAVKNVVGGAAELVQGLAMDGEDFDVHDEL